MVHKRAIDGNIIHFESLKIESLLLINKIYYIIVYYFMNYIKLIHKFVITNTKLNIYEKKLLLVYFSLNRPLKQLF